MVGERGGYMLLLVTYLYPLDEMGHQTKVKVRLYPMKLLMMIRRGAVISARPSLRATL